MGRGKSKPGGDGPERRCLVTKVSCEKQALVRFVVAPDKTVVPDILGKLPGRGMWVSANFATLQTAVTQNHFARAAREKVHVPDTMVSAVEAALANRVIGLLALARKAGDAVVGYEKVKGWLDSGEAKVLVQASDGSARGKSKLRPPNGKNSLIEALTASELGAAFGRENVIHGALAAGGLTNRVVEEAARLAGLRPSDCGAMAPGKDS